MRGIDGSRLEVWTSWGPCAPAAWHLQVEVRGCQHLLGHRPTCLGPDWAGPILEKGKLRLRFTRVRTPQPRAPFHRQLGTEQALWPLIKGTDEPEAQVAHKQGCVPRTLQRLGGCPPGVSPCHLLLPDEETRPHKAV